MRKPLLWFLCMLLCAHLTAQNRTITGKVTDENGLGIPNTSVLIKGTTSGTTTSSDGVFSLSIPSSARTLVISSIGMVQQEIRLTNSNVYQINLSSDSKDLQEVVVVGYGAQ